MVALTVKYGKNSQAMEGSPFIKNYNFRTSLAVQWLGLQASTAGGTGLIPGRGTRILHGMQCGQKNNNNNNKKLQLYSE